MKFYHVADVHLGRRRLDGRLPDEDMAVAFRFIAEAAVVDRADVFLIAGDLFDRSQVEPPHLRQAEDVLGLLKEAGIPVVAIEGNHDKHFVHSDEPTWVQYLCEDGLLTLLRPAFGPEGAILKPWDPDRRRGSWIDIGGARFVGAGYLGAATPAKVRQILDAVDPGMPIVMLLHAGPDYFVGEGGGFSREDLALLKDRVRYLALGHIHRPMRHGDFARNPGSPENCDLREAAHDPPGSGEQAGRGYAVVEFDPAVAGGDTRIEIRSNPRRPCRMVELDCSPFGNKTKHGSEALVKAAVAEIREGRAPPEAVIDLRLVGRLNLNRIALDQAVASEEIREGAGVFAVSIDSSRLNIEGGGFGGPDGAAMVSREDLEKGAIRSVVDEQQLWGLCDRAQEFADLFFGLKESVRLGASRDALAEQVLQSPLLGCVRDALAAAASGQAGGKAEGGETR